MGSALGFGFSLASGSVGCSRLSPPLQLGTWCSLVASISSRSATRSKLVALGTTSQTLTNARWVLIGALVTSRAAIVREVISADWLAVFARCLPSFALTPFPFPALVFPFPGPFPPATLAIAEDELACPLRRRSSSSSCVRAESSISSNPMSCKRLASVQRVLMFVCLYVRDTSVLNAVSLLINEEIRVFKEVNSRSGSGLPPRSVTTVKTCCRHARKVVRASLKVLAGLRGAPMVARPSTRALGSEGR